VIVSQSKEQKLSRRYSATTRSVWTYCISHGQVALREAAIDEIETTTRSLKLHGEVVFILIIILLHHGERVVKCVQYVCPVKKGVKSYARASIQMDEVSNDTILTCAAVCAIGLSLPRAYLLLTARRRHPKTGIL
jgi:hypothetical protein